jgi:hypothetical protein
MEDDSLSRKVGKTTKLFKKLSASLRRRFGSVRQPLQRQPNERPALIEKDGRADAPPSPPEDFDSCLDDTGSEQMRKFREALAGSSPSTPRNSSSRDVSVSQSTSACFSGVLLSPPRAGVVDDLPPLHKAVVSGDLARVSSLLDAGHDVDELDGKDTALHLAVRAGQPEALQILLDKRASLDERDSDGWTPMHHACMLVRPSPSPESYLDLEQLFPLSPRGQFCFTKD